MRETTLALAMLKEGAAITHIATDLHVSKHAVSDLKQVAKGFQTTPCQPEKQEQGLRRPLMGVCDARPFNYYS